jgi:glyoxylase-like metal-dependent hydrolase (beta-lactamase superfamily II)
LHQIDPRPIYFVILTNAHGDRLLNLRWLNARIIAHQHTATRLASYDKRYPQAMLDSLILRRPESSRDLSNGPVERADISFDKVLCLTSHGVDLELRHMPGPDPGNICVQLPGKSVAFCGDALIGGLHPLLARADLNAWLETLARLQQPPYDDMTLIPGRGAKATQTQEDIELLKAFLYDVQEEIQSLHQAQRPRGDVSSLVVKFLPRFQVNLLPREWVQAQLRAGLEHVYDALKDTAGLKTEPVAIQE